MARFHPMRSLARWHIWVGWLIAVPLLLWTASGLFMVARPIETVRGEPLRIEQPKAALPRWPVAPAGLDARRPVEIRSFVQRGMPIVLATYADGSVRRFSEGGRPLPPLDRKAALIAVVHEIRGGDRVIGAKLYSAERPAFDFRREVPVWQVTLADGTHVYVGRDSGAIEAVRTPFWRVYDTMWGLHIMDLQTREDTHHPLLIAFAVLALAGCLMGTILLFRRRQRPG